MSDQIKSRKRVSEHGEVFTAQREVDAMLDLVKPETERIDSRFLEPACGTGNYLVSILERKLDVIYRTRTAPSRHVDVAMVSQEMVQAVTSIYGIEILEDNVAECRERLYGILLDWYPRATQGKGLDGELAQTVRYVLGRNILWGDALTLCTPDDAKRPIIFSEWGFIGRSVKRRDFTLDMLLRPRTMAGPSLFDELGDDVFIPEPCAEYPLVDYLKIYTQDATTK